MFLNWVDIVKAFLFTMESILLSSNNVVLHGCPERVRVLFFFRGGGLVFNAAQCFLFPSECSKHL